MLASATPLEQSHCCDLQLKDFHSLRISDQPKSDQNNNNNKNSDEWDYQNTIVWVEKYPKANGKHQSPIDIITYITHFDERLVKNPLEFTYDKDCFYDLKNTGHSFNVSGLPNANSRVIGGPVQQEHKFLQFHMHWGASDSVGSEHLVDGRSYAAEIHFVNWNSEKYSDPSEAVKSNNHDGLCVLGVLVQVGAHNLEFDKIIPSLTDISLKDKKAALRHSLDFKNLFPADTSSYWTYEGSLTTPPCTECVQWVVFKNPIQISHNQLKAFHRLYKCMDDSDCCDLTQITTNFRPVCDMNDRKLYRSFND